MARKPAPLQATGKLTPRERIWAAIRALGAGQARFTRDDIADWCVKYAPPRTTIKRIADVTIAAYVTGLVAAGYLLRAYGVGRYAKARYHLARDVGVDAPRLTREGREVTLGRITLALWRALHVHAKEHFDSRELAAWASVDAQRVAPATAATYCKFLGRAGYLQLLAPAKPGALTRYRLAKHTGPKAPVVTHVKHVYDPNLGEVVWHPAVHA